jgi:hypothetical protein
MMASSGCVYLQNILQPNNPTATPVVTITPTPAPRPTATLAPSPVMKQVSNDVRVLPAGEKGLIDFKYVKDVDFQSENITVFLANEGKSTAKNIVVTLTVTDAHGGNDLAQQQFSIGDMGMGDRKLVSLQTNGHDPASSVLITIKNIEWGDSGEYYNPTVYLNVAKSIWT